MKHVLGMAKRHLDLKGAKGPKLELDFLRLVYAVKELRYTGAEAQGYLLVVDEKVKQRAKGWQKKYEAGDTVKVCLVPFEEAELEMVRSEIRENVAGMVAGTLGEDVAGRSSAARGGNLAERKLKRLIEGREPGVRQCHDQAESPFGIQWDYYGQREV